MSKTVEAAHRFPRGEIGILDLGKIAGGRKRRVAALLEVDVTKARRLLGATGAAAGKTPLLAWLVSQTAVSIRRHPQVHRLRGADRRNEAVGAVDVTVLIERPFESRAFETSLLIRSADTKTVAEITQEILLARSTPLTLDEILKNARPLFGTIPARLCYAIAPKIAREKMVSRWVSRGRAKKPTRHVVVNSTSLGTRFQGWLLPAGSNTVSIAMGAVSPKASVINGRIEARDKLHLTVVLESSPRSPDEAGRWISSLVRGMESGSTLAKSLAAL
ncbi:MAG: hypothetical protein ACLFP4_08995 [Spirochaetales bacterium]